MINPSLPYSSNTIDYITIATTGTATDFGDMTSKRDSLAACSGNQKKEIIKYGKSIKYNYWW